MRGLDKEVETRMAHLQSGYGNRRRRAGVIFNTTIERNKKKAKFLYIFLEVIQKGGVPCVSVLFRSVLFTRLSSPPI